MSRRIRHIVILGLLVLGVVAIIPGPYSEDGPWHTLDGWASELRLKWEYRTRTLYVSCGWRRLLFCQELPTRSGPMARIADSTLALVAKLECQQWSSNRMAGVLLPGEERPILSCHSSTGGMSVGLGLDWEGFVYSFDRGWTAADPRKAYAEVVQGMEARHGEGRMCPQSDDLTFTENLRWQLDELNVGVYLAQNRYVHVDYAYGEIFCHLL